jgi:hypothetical protein
MRRLEAIVEYKRWALARNPSKKNEIAQTDIYSHAFPTTPEQPSLNSKPVYFRLRR